MVQLCADCVERLAPSRELCGLCPSAVSLAFRPSTPLLIFITFGLLTETLGEVVRTLHGPGQRYRRFTFSRAAFSVPGLRSCALRRHNDWIIDFSLLVFHVVG
jgi:hypothetical protein